MTKVGNTRDTKKMRAALLPAGLVLALLVGGCGSKTAAATSNSSSSAAAPSSMASSAAAPSSAAAAASAPAAPVASGITSSAAMSSGPAASGAAASGAPVSGAPISGAPSSALPATTINTTDPAAVKSLAALDAALLTAAEVGTGFTKVPASPSKHNTPLPCGGTSTDQLYPNALRVEADAAKGDVQFQDAIEHHGDAATAEKVYAINASGLDCAKGTIGATAVTIGKPIDVTSQAGATKATAWEINLTVGTGVLILTQVGSIVASYAFFAPAGTPTEKLPDATGIAKVGTAKIIAAAIG